MKLIASAKRIAMIVKVRILRLPTKETYGNLITMRFDNGGGGT